METLTMSEAMEVSGGEVTYVDFLYGVLFAIDLVCMYTRQPYFCAAAVIGHGIDLIWG